MPLYLKVILFQNVATSFWKTSVSLELSQVHLRFLGAFRLKKKHKAFKKNKGNKKEQLHTGKNQEYVYCMWDRIAGLSGRSLCPWNGPSLTMG